MIRGFTICGTSTEVGKTITSAILTNMLNGLYYKPIQTGSIEKTDTDTIKEYLGSEVLIPPSFTLKEPLSPHIAFEIENKSPDISKLYSLPETKKTLIVETVGGVLTPITRKVLQIELIKEWFLPVILVCKTTLGTINASLLSIEALRKRNINILGLIFSGKDFKDNRKTICEISNLPEIGWIPELKYFNKKEFYNVFKNNFNNDLIFSVLK